VTGSTGGREPISWEALAAELAAELSGRDDDRGSADAWDAVAAQLAAALRPTTGGVPAPREPDGVPRSEPDPDPAADPVAAEVAATVEEAPHPHPSHRDAPQPDQGRDRATGPLSRAPRSPVELVVVDPPEPAVEEDVPAAAQDDEPGASAADRRALRAGLEALLFVVDTPVDEASLAAALRCSVPQVREQLTGLADDYERRRAGVVLRRVGEGWRVYTREEHAAVVERYLLEGQRSRLTQAALETLAVIAYRQPVTRARVSAIRGVGVDAVVRTLVNRGLVRECGSDPDTGGGLYATTPLFLERLGLTSLAELPALAPLVPETSTLLAEHPDD